MKIKWKEHFLYKGYFASENGDVKHIYKNGKEKILKQRENEKGYLTFELSHNKKRVKYRSHRFIFECFSGEKLGKKEINHKNKIKGDNSIQNLEVLSRGENVRHAYIGKKRGITKSTRTESWESQINISGKVIYLGTSKTKDEAYNKYYNKYKEHYGEAPW